MNSKSVMVAGFWLSLGLLCCVPNRGFGQNAISTGTNAGFRMYRAGQNDWWLDPSKGNFDIRMNGLPPFATLNSQGYLGIGTTNPTSPFIAVGPSPQVQAIATAASPNGFYTAINNAGINAYFGIYGSAAAKPNTTVVYSNAGSDIGIFPEGIEVMRFKSSGNVGIGTTSPTAKLNVSGNILATGDISGATINGGTPLMSPMSSTLSINATPALATNQPGIQVSTNFFVMGGGKVGIGTTNAAQILTLRRTAPAILLANDGGAANDNPLVQWNPVASLTGLLFQSGGQTVGQIQDNGDFVAQGFDTYSGLHIRSNLSIERGGGNGPKISFGDPGVSTAFGFDSQTDFGTTHLFDLKNAGTTRLTVDSLGNVGIGTTSPAASLQVNGAIRATAFANPAPGTGASLELGYDSFNGAGAVQAYDRTANAWKQINMNAAPLIINSAGGSGNVGIGTTSPGAKLDVNGTVNATSFTGSFAGTVSGTQTGLIQSNAVGTSYITGGSVGIGTTSPFASLHVEQGAANAVGLSLRRQQASGNPVLQFSDETSHANYIAMSTTTGSLLLGTNVGPNGDGSQFILAASGSVGVGTPTPGRLLDIESGNLAAAIRVGGTYAGGRAWDFGDGIVANGLLTIQDATVGVPRLSINSGGYVGIGTTNPQYPLDVVAVSGATNGTAQILESPATNTPSYTRYSNPGLTGYGLVGVEGSAGGKIITGDTPYAMAITAGVGVPLQFGYNNGTGVAMTVNSSGNVGIGPASPLVNLHVFGSASSPATSGTTPNGILAISNGNTFTTLYGGAYVAAPYAFWLQAAERNNLATNDALVLNPNGGSVGIGLQAPNWMLDVAQGINVNRLGVVTSGFVNGITMGGWDALAYPSSGNNLVLGGYRASQWDAIRLYTSGSEKVRIDANGYVGIGTTSPGSKLDVSGDINYTGSLRQNGSVVNVNNMVKAWVNFNGATCSTTCTMLGSFNVSSVTRNSGGNYTLTFTTPMADSNYVALGNTSYGSFHGVVDFKQFGGTSLTYSTTALQVLVIAQQSNTDTVFDAPYVGVMVVGN